MLGQSFAVPGNEGWAAQNEGFSAPCTNGAANDVVAIAAVFNTVRRVLKFVPIISLPQVAGGQAPKAAGIRGCCAAASGKALCARSKFF